MTNPLAPRVDIIIPTHNRAHLIETAVGAALDQSWWNIQVTVVDDAGSDNTQEVLRPYFGHRHFNYVRLQNNLGTAHAKNAGLLVTGGDAVTFHDSDDIPHRDKVLHQVRRITQQGMKADECLNWKLAGHRPGGDLECAAVLVHHELILPDGRREVISRDLSLLDDLFPNLQLGSGVPGEWTHVNSGLFREALFQRLGGFDDCIEEDREFRNRVILSGEVLRVIPEVLLTKIETPDSLTQSAASDYDSPRRVADRHAVWRKVEAWKETGQMDPVPVDIPDLEIAFVSNPAALSRRDLPMSARTRAAIDRFLGRMDVDYPLEAAQ